MKKQKDDIIITSVAQFVEEVTKICINEYDVKRSSVFFRGEADKKWETRASLLRGDKNDSNLQENDVFVQMEYDLISNAKKCYPELFKSCQDSIDRIVEMQHYGLPTRLLDVTENPFVALYFACESEFKKDGTVLFTYKEPLDHYCTNIIATLCEHWQDYRNLNILDKRSMGKPDDYPIREPNEFMGLKSFLNLLRDNGVCEKEKDIDVLRFLFYYLPKSFLYVPNYTNPRIQAQKGAFIFSAFMQPDFMYSSKYIELVKDGENRKLEEKEMTGIRFEKMCVSLRNEFEKKRFVIKKNDKKHILKELCLLGINEAFVYPEPEHQMKTVRDEVVMSHYHPTEQYFK
ncbi:MAG: FRG domain-containing protein [Salinivirgaceae bacterium]|nr:FRG domain-containing protein [Salinivirgaceae bacterium]